MGIVELINNEIEKLKQIKELKNEDEIKIEFSKYKIKIFENLEKLYIKEDLIFEFKNILNEAALRINLQEDEDLLNMAFQKFKKIESSNMSYNDTIYESCNLVLEELNDDFFKNKIKNKFSKNKKEA